MNLATGYAPFRIIFAIFCLVTILGPDAAAQMEYTLNNGHKIPALGLGTAMASGLETVVKAAVDAGYRLIDTAFLYYNEMAIGKGLKVVFHNGKVKREDLFIISKLGNNQHRPSEVAPAIKKSLADLQLEYLDLYLIHWPFALQPGEDKEDKNVTIEDTWRAMEELVKRGYTRSIGLSNFNSHQIERILKIATIKPVVNEVECNPYMSQEKLREFCKQREISVIAYSPLYSTGRNESHHGLNLFKESIVEQLAQKYKKTQAQIVLRYLVQCEVIPIPKTDKLNHLQGNIKIYDFVIEPEDFEKMRTLNKNRRTIDPRRYENFTEYPFKAEF